MQESGQASEWIPTAQLSALRLLRALAPTMTSKQLGSVLGEDDAHSLVRERPSYGGSCGPPCNTGRAMPVTRYSACEITFRMWDCLSVVVCEVYSAGCRSAAIVPVLFAGAYRHHRGTITAAVYANRRGTFLWRFSKGKVSHVGTDHALDRLCSIRILVLNLPL